MSQEYFKDVLSVWECFKSVSRVFQEYFKSVSIVFESVSLVFYEWFKIAMRVLGHGLLILSSPSPRAMGMEGGEGI